MDIRNCLRSAETITDVGQRMSSDAFEYGVFVLFVHFVAVKAQEAACSKAERSRTFFHFDGFSIG
ncbi:hypothetical protein [Paraburkholderia diazotrophica]|uniref:hypothetical protein n=1 Tax=Paraburkholderia diazotrophica TaxID=667676 RepID=UPI00316D4057